MSYRLSYRHFSTVVIFRHLWFVPFVFWFVVVLFRQCLGLSWQFGLLRLCAYLSVFRTMFVCTAYSLNRLATSGFYRSVLCKLGLVPSVF